MRFSTFLTMNTTRMVAFWMLVATQKALQWFSNLRDVRAWNHHRTGSNKRASAEGAVKPGWCLANALLCQTCPSSQASDLLNAFIWRMCYILLISFAVLSESPQDSGPKGSIDLQSGKVKARYGLLSEFSAVMIHHNVVATADVAQMAIDSPS